MAKPPLVTKVKLYRKLASSPTHIVNESPMPGTVYHEFEEIWVRPCGDEACKHTRRVSQRSTGNSYRFLDNVSPELLEDDMPEREFSKRCLMLVKPADFTYVRLMRI